MHAQYVKYPSPEALALFVCRTTEVGSSQSCLSSVAPKRPRESLLVVYQLSLKPSGVLKILLHYRMTVVSNPSTSLINF
jgi:hypothetical protein